jgi:16S rRNA processing protein RimM
VRVEIHTDEPDRFLWLERVLVGEHTLTPIEIENARFHQKVVILKLKGLETRNAAEALRNQLLLVPLKEAVPLEEDEAFLFQLVGMTVITTEDEWLGDVTEVLQTGANDVLVVASPAGELLIPDIPDVVLQVDLETGRILVELPPGLRDE